MVRILKSIYIQLIICSLWQQGGSAQPRSLATSPVFRVDHIGVTDGLTQGSVYYMLKDSRGFLWFGTQDGLNRYDGHHFRTFRPALAKNGAVLPGSIRGINIFGIIEDPDGNLWIGTEEGLNRYDRQHDRFECLVANDPASKQKQLTSRTLPFFVNQTELLYLSDAEGLVRYEYRNHRKTILEADLHPTREYDLQSSTVRTPAGDVWLHAPTGVIRYNLRTKTRSYYFSNHPQNQAGPAQVVFSFFVDEDNVAWIGAKAGLIRFDYRQQTYQRYDTLGARPLKAINSISPDQRGQLWLGTQEDGLLYFDKRTRLFGQVNDLSNNGRPLSEFKISKVYVDNRGIVWGNTDPDGLVRILPDAFLFGGIVKRPGLDTLPQNQKLSSYSIRGFLEERFDRLWVLTENGINVIDPRTNRIVERYLSRVASASGASLMKIKSLYRDPQRRIWVGATGGVLAYKPDTKTFDPILFATSSGSLVGDNYVRNMVSISDTLLIAATESGLYALNTRRRRWTKVPVLDDQNIFSLSYNTSAHQLWIGTFLNGYYCYQLPDPNTAESKAANSWTFVKSGLRGYTVLNIRPDESQQTIWLACDRGLVALTDNTNRFYLYTERQGLANSFVYGTLADAQNNIWMSTNRGISRLNPGTQTIKNFRLNDGLQGYEFNGNAYFKTASGEMYFGGVNGFNRCLPDAFRSSSFNPYVHIYSLNSNEEPLVGNVYVGEAKRIDVDHTQNTLALEFAAIDFTSNGHNGYQYQLTNYDNHWVMAGERNYVRYANLPPGDYLFQVKAANQDGHWSNYTRSLAIHIEPPFWLRWPFVVLVLGLLAAIIWLWVRQREKAIRNQEADRLQLAYDIQEQVKKDIARDLHDEIGTRLATIKLYTTQLTQQAGETPVILALKTTIFQLINDTISDVRNLLRKLNPQTLVSHGYVAAVEELFSRITASGIINAEFDPVELSEEGNRFLPDTEVMLYRITQELVSNSLKHANADQINLHMVRQADRMMLIYQDNGRGFDYEQTRKKAAGLGIGNIESRVAILGGRIVWQTQTGQGLQATIDVPIIPVRKRSAPVSRTNSPLPD